MASAREQIRAELDKLCGRNGVLGAFLVSRDGINVVDVSHRPVNQEMIAAMSAMMMGAAETAVAEVGNLPPRHLVVETDDAKFLVLGATPDLLLAILGDSNADVPGILQKFAPVLEAVRSLSE